MPLSETRIKELELRILEGGIEIVGLAKLMNACLSEDVEDNHLELGKAHG